jgi:hypothetical protein
LNVGLLIGDNFYDRGSRPFSFTTTTTIGKTIAEVLEHAAETENKYIEVHDAVVTQRQLAKIAEKTTEKPYGAYNVSTEEQEMQYGRSFPSETRT